MNLRTQSQAGSNWRRRTTGCHLCRTFLLFVTLVFPAAFSGCVKRTVKVPVSPNLLNARVATFEDLLAKLEGYGDRVASLKSTTVRITFTSGKVETGRLQQYRGAPGYILLERPDRIRLTVQNPITKSALAELASVGDNFELWVPSENRFFTGRNSAREFESQEVNRSPLLSARPIHIYEAILPQAFPVGQAGYRIALKEEQDLQAKYYVIGIYRELQAPRLRPVRDIWIERSNLTVARQVTYDDDGAIASRISYLKLSADPVPLPLSMRIERPLDGYMIDLEIRSWTVNPQLEPRAFVLTRPEGAEHVILGEKKRSGAS